MSSADFVSLLRIVLAVPTAILILEGNLLSASLLIALAGLSDFLDGYLARSTGKQTDLGKVIDPLADKIFLLTTFIALIKVSDLDPLPVILLVIRDLGVTIMRHSVPISSTFGASALAKVKTSLLFLCAFLMTLGFEEVEILLWIGVILSYISALEYVGYNIFLALRR